MKLKTVNGAIARYILAGGLAYAVELTCLLLLNKTVGMSAEVSTAIAFWIGLVTSFLLQKIFAFRDYQKTIGAITHQAASYGVLVTFNYIFTLVVVGLFPDNLLVFSRTLALVITTGWNYYIYKKVIFSDKGIDPQKLWSYIRKNRRPMTMGMLATILVLAFFYQYLSTPHKLINGDFDYYAQQYEAARISVLHYHQFPWWNPWISGGVPLFSNPQFGLFSLQFLLVLPFGTILGMKLAYIFYALAGFWGMYALCRHVLATSRTRSYLVSYLWIFSGFFAGHNISHYTFPSYFLWPWLLYFLARRHHKGSWLGFALTESVIILSSVHYAFLMSALVVGIYFVLSITWNRYGRNSKQFFSRRDVSFVAKAAALIVILAGYRLMTTYYFVSHNQKSQTILKEPPTNPLTLLEALFYPVDSVAPAPKTTWSWGEYSMYIGVGSAAALLVIIYSSISTRAKSLLAVLKKSNFISYTLIVALIASCLAVGDFANWSPFHLLHNLPGFAKTRVSARWQVFTMFALLILFAAWKTNDRLINFLLFLGVVELFFSFGPPRINGSGQIPLPPASFSSSFTEYDNGQQHTDANQHIMHSYFYTTEQNIGQVYADDSLVDTLHGTRLTRRCGLNLNPKCTFITSGNASLDYWSPNRILITRTGPGEIRLNMNVEAGWRINGTYQFAAYKDLDPARLFVLPAGATNYELQYAPKLSPSWLNWRVHRL